MKAKLESGNIQHMIRADLPSKCHFTSFLYTLEVRKRAVDPKMEATCLEFNIIMNMHRELTLVSFMQCSLKIIKNWFMVGVCP